MPSVLDHRSRRLRRVMLDALYHGGRGHLPSACSCVEILRVLYDSVLRVSPEEPDRPGDDHFILSKGHGCLALYVLLAEKGFFPAAELGGFCAFDSLLGGHPDRRIPGVAASSGSLGHGPAVGVGLAQAARLDGLDSRVFVLCGDGETDEGSVWEALLMAAKHRLDRFSLIVDYNRMQSWDAVAEILPLEPYADKFRAFGAAVREVDGHDPAALLAAFESLPFEPGRPSVLVAHTVKGRGFPSLENNLAWHHRSRVTEAEYQALMAELESRS